MKEEEHPLAVSAGQQREGFRAETVALLPGSASGARGLPPGREGAPHNYQPLAPERATGHSEPVSLLLGAREADAPPSGEGLDGLPTQVNHRGSG